VPKGNAECSSSASSMPKKGGKKKKGGESGPMTFSPPLSSQPQALGAFHRPRSRSVFPINKGGGKGGKEERNYSLTNREDLWHVFLHAKLFISRRGRKKKKEGGGSGLRWLIGKRYSHLVTPLFSGEGGRGKKKGRKARIFLLNLYFLKSSP